MYYILYKLHAIHKVINIDNIVNVLYVKLITIFLVIDLIIIPILQKCSPRKVNYLAQGWDWLPSMHFPAPAMLPCVFLGFYYQVYVPVWQAPWFTVFISIPLVPFPSLRLLFGAWKTLEVYKQLLKYWPFCISQTRRLRPRRKTLKSKARSQAPWPLIIVRTNQVKFWDVTVPKKQEPALIEILRGSF